jgi:ABC-type cobalamin/Fe3+-siderophores transport system ATPase subunit
MSDSILTTHNLAISNKTSQKTVRCVASDISVSLQTGELVCLLGLNCACNSTLLRSLAGMQPPFGRKYLREHQKIMIASAELRELAIKKLLINLRIRTC